MITVYEVLAAPPFRVQLEALRAAFPDWIIVLCGFAGERWLEASRPRYRGPGPCALVARDPAALWRALRDAAAAEHPIIQAVRDLP